MTLYAPSRYAVEQRKAQLMVIQVNFGVDVFASLAFLLRTQYQRIVVSMAALAASAAFKFASSTLCSQGSVSDCVQAAAYLIVCSIL